MNEYLLRRLSPTEYLNKILPTIKEAFIEFYGEDKREYIENKFNNIILLGSLNPDNIKIMISNLYKDFTNNSLKSLCDEMKIENSSEFIKKYFGDYSFEYVSLMPINKYIKYIKTNQMASAEEKQENKYSSLKEDAVAFLKTIDSNVNIENIDEFIKHGKFEYLDKIALKMDELLIEFEKFKNYLKPYNDYCSECDKLKTQIKNTYMKELIMEFADVVPQEELENYLSGKSSYTYPYLSALFGYSIDSTSCIDCFSKENEDILLSKKNNWKKNSIISDRIKYFKLKGIDLGNDYEAYKLSNECNSIIPSQELIEKLQKTKLKYQTLFQNEYYTSIQGYKENRELIDKHNLLCKDDDYNASIFIHRNTFVSPNVKLENNQPVLYPLININFDLILPTLDASIIHEFNHLYELSLQGISENQISFLCGWDYLSQNLTSNSSLVEIEDNQNKRNYELFNEIINEIIAQKISAIIQGKEVHFFNTPEEAKIKYGTSYECTMFLVSDFYNEFEMDIIKSREEGNIYHIFDVVGKENFDNLNELFNIFNERWPELKYYSLMDDLKDKIETNDTKAYYELIEKRDKILNKMREHKAMYEQGMQIK